MSAETFPTLIGVDVVVTRTTVYATKVQRSGSGMERRARLQSTPLYRFRFKINSLRTTRASNEVATLASFFERMAGQWDTFTFVDPVDGTSRTCRFEEDELDIEKIVATLFSSGVTFITVKP